MGRGGACDWVSRGTGKGPTGGGTAHSTEQTGRGRESVVVMGRVEGCLRGGCMRGGRGVHQTTGKGPLGWAVWPRARDHRAEPPDRQLSASPTQGHLTKESL